MSGWKVMLLALGWVFIIEGLGPMAATEKWRRALGEIQKAPLSLIRTVGTILVCVGLAIVWLAP